MSRGKLAAAAVWVFLSNLALAWWVKGDLEFGWIVGLPVILAGGPVFGALSAVVLRSWRASLAMTGASALWAVALGFAALHTPNSWKRAPAGLEWARRIASDREAIRKAAEAVTGYAVEPQVPGQVQVTDSYITKQGFSFRLVNRPGEAKVWVSFDIGPMGGAEFDVAPRGGYWTLRPRFVPSNALTVRAPALERRFPHARVIEAGGNGPYLRGDLLPVRILRGESDWDIVLLRIADGGEPLREVARYSREDLMRSFSKVVEAAGIGPLEAAVTYCRPVRPQDVFFFMRPEFSFIGILGNERYWRAEIVARLSGGGLRFELANRLVRPAPGSPGAVGDRRGG